MRYHLSIKSSNRKTGPIPVSTSSKKNCPDSCPLKDHGCYGTGQIAIHWNKVTDGLRGVDIDSHCQDLERIPAGQLWRAWQVGDWPGSNNRLRSRDCRKIAAAAGHARGFSYTHYPPTKHNIKVLESIRSSILVNLSADTLTEADRFVETGLPVVTLLPEDAPKVSYTPAGHKIVKCPAKPGQVTCANCQLCARDNRGFIIGFPVHGTQKRKALEVYND